jgi:hypothetical protein
VENRQRELTKYRVQTSRAQAFTEQSARPQRTDRQYADRNAPKVQRHRPQHNTQHSAQWLEDKGLCATMQCSTDRMRTDRMQTNNQQGADVRTAFQFWNKLYIARRNQTERRIHRPERHIANQNTQQGTEDSVQTNRRFVYSFAVCYPAMCVRADCFLALFTVIWNIFFPLKEPNQVQRSENVSWRSTPCSRLLRVKNERGTRR